MTFEKFKTYLWGAFFGAIGWWVALAFGFGWTSAATTQTQTAEAVSQALVPVCADQFEANDAWLAELKKAGKYEQEDVVRKYVKKIGDRDVDYRLGRECLAEINKRTQTAASSH